MTESYSTNNPFASCDGKIKYQTGLEAGKAKDRMDKKHNRHKVNVYRCQFCAGWHIGHQRKII